MQKNATKNYIFKLYKMYVYESNFVFNNSCPVKKKCKYYNLLALIITIIYYIKAFWCTCFTKNIY